MNARSTPRAIAFGIVSALGVILVYGLLSEPLELTLGLLAVSFFGGWIIGNSIAYGAWSNNPHDTDRPMQWFALTISVGAWVGALILAFTISQALIPDPTFPLSSRLNVNDFFTYLLGLEFVPVIHVIALALLAIMAWRGAR